MRMRGTGSVSREGGAWRARLPGLRRTVATAPTEEEAAAELERALAELRGAVGAKEAKTLGAYGAEWIAQRARFGVKRVEVECSRWTQHVEMDPIGGAPIALLTRGDVKAWIVRLRTKSARSRVGELRRPLSRATVARCLSLLRGALAAAVEEGIVETNVADGVKVPRILRGEEGTREVGAVLLWRELWALFAAPLVRECKVMVAFAIATGLRSSEQWNLEIRDVDTESERPHVVVRYGEGGRATKGGRVRVVPLFGLGLLAAKEALERASARVREGTNPYALLFPSASGRRRPRGAPKRWAAWKRRAGVRAEVRWHDLRHTCGTWLVRGAWGRKWTPLEVKEALGHRSLRTTEIYLHVSTEDVFRAAKETRHAQAFRVTDPLRRDGDDEPPGRSGETGPSEKGSEMAERVAEGTDCKSVIRGFESHPHLKDVKGVDWLAVGVAIGALAAGGYGDAARAIGGVIQALAETRSALEQAQKIGWELQQQLSARAGGR